jgi:endonuclease/exonuclease/phosphatase (EEP) superfamily protein YafD
MRIFLFGLGVVVSGLTLGSLLGRFHWTLDVLSHFHVQYLLLLSGATLGLLWLRAKRSALLLLPALAVNIVLIAPFWLPAYPTVEAASAEEVAPLRVMAMNISTSNAGYGEVVARIRSENPDIVYLSEVREDLVTLLQAELGASYPVQYAEPSRHTLGVAILARDPNVQVQTVGFGDDVGRMRRRYLRADFDWHGTPVTLAGIHPLPPMRGGWAESRDREIDAMAQLAQEVGRPFILVGDFNAAPWSQPMQALTRETDLAYAGGFAGILPTWFLGPPALKYLLGAPLDHMLTSRDWIEIGYKRLPGIRSDHVPVQVDLVLKQS